MTDEHAEKRKKVKSTGKWVGLFYRNVNRFYADKSRSRVYHSGDSRLG